mgnify:CR=1 FL=1
MVAWNLRNYVKLKTETFLIKPAVPGGLAKLVSSKIGKNRHKKTVNPLHKSVQILYECAPHDYGSLKPKELQ